MYTSFLYFIVVLLVFATQQPTLTPRLDGPLTLGACLMLLVLFALVSHEISRRLCLRMSRVPDESRLPLLYHRSLSQQMFLALVFFCLHLYLLDIKFYLTSVALLRRSFTLQGTAAIGLFLLHLVIVWLCSHRCHCLLTGTRPTKTALVATRLKFNLAILLPWLLISGAFDLLQLLPLDLGGHWLLTPSGQILFFGVLLVLFVLFAPPLILHLWGCRPLPAGRRRSLIQQFCREHRFQIREILLWPTYGGELLTAGVMGLHPRWRYLLVTPGLLQLLADDELQAVLAHEMGHVKEGHLYFYLLFLVGYLLLSYALVDFGLFLLLFAGLPLKFLTQPLLQGTTLSSLLTTLPLLVLLVVYFRYLFGFFIRNFERQADLHVFAVMDRPVPLISALEKVGRYSGNTREVPSWHHFSIKQRVAYLAAAAARPSLRLEHRRRLKRALTGYLVGLTALGTAGLLLHTEALDHSLRQGLIIKILRQEVRRWPENARLRLALGTLCYERHELKEAVRQLELALQLEPLNPEILNNLAWILATGRGPSFSQPRRALALAQKAARLSPKAYILDTLAEAYHVNGQPKLALAAAERALAAATTNRSYYARQVERFRSFLNGPAAVEFQPLRSGSENQ